MRSFIWPALLFALIWLGAYGYSVAYAGGDPLAPWMTLGLFGLAIPFAVHLITKGASPLPTTEEVSWLEPFALVFLIAVIVGFFVVSGRAPVEIAQSVWPGSQSARLFTVAAFNLFFFVVLPYGVMSVLIRHPLSSFGWHSPPWRMLPPRHLIILIFLGGGMIVLQVLITPLGEPFREGAYDAEAIAVAMPIVFLWIAVTAGLTQGFFFHGVLQSRAAMLLGNDWAGLFLAALVAGLIYVPGQIFRAIDMGLDPAIFATNAVLNGSVSALMFGFIWMRTRNLLLLMLLSGAMGLIASFGGVAEAFGLI